MTRPQSLVALALAVCACTLTSSNARAQDLAEGWLAPWRHEDVSPRGTPFVHMFNLEPAFLDRDLFVDYVATKTAEEDERERELAVELEYALTQRIGVVVEAPYVLLNPEEGDTEHGLGDAAVAPRALIVQTDRFLLAGNLEFTFPTGSARRGLGGGEAAIAPSVSTWLDLGNWVALSTQVGTEHGLETGDAELFYAGALTWSFMGPTLFRHEQEAHAEHAHAQDHLGPGLTSLIAEFSGTTVLTGDEAHRTTMEVLFGVSHVLTENLAVRAAVQLPVGGTRDIEYGYIVGLIYHF